MVKGKLNIHIQRNKLGLYLTTYTTINIKWAIDLNVPARTIKLLETNIGINVCYHGLSNSLLDITPKAQ